MFTTLSTYEELGIHEDEVRHERLRRGSKDLIPREYIKKLRTITVRLRQSLDRHSLSLTVFRPYRYVYFKSYDAWKAEFDGLCREFDALKKTLLDQYDELYTQCGIDFTAVASEAYSTLRNRGATTEPKAQFINRVVSQALAKFPSRERIETDLKADYHTSLLITDVDYATEVAKKDQAQAEAYEANQKAHLAAQATRQGQREADVKLQAMRQAELEHARQQLKTMVSPITEAMFRLRSQLGEQVARSATSSSNTTGCCRHARRKGAQPADDVPAPQRGRRQRDRGIAAQPYLSGAERHRRKRQGPLQR